MKEIFYSPESLQDLLDAKKEITIEFGEEVAKRILSKITKTIQNLSIYEEMGVELSKQYEIPCDYRLFYTQKNYIFYRIEDDSIRIIRILDERRDFMQVLFGINTTIQES